MENTYLYKKKSPRPESRRLCGAGRWMNGLGLVAVGALAVSDGVATLVVDTVIPGLKHHPDWEALVLSQVAVNALAVSDGVATFIVPFLVHKVLLFIFLSYFSLKTKPNTINIVLVPLLINLIKRHFCTIVNTTIARSSNGRTTVSGTVYLGSNPSLAASTFSVICYNKNMEKYNKLVRDKIPYILDKKGTLYEKRIATPEEYKTELIKKLEEETREFSEAGSSEELADVIEVIEALKKLPEYANVEELRKKKAEERGTFSQRIILKGEKD